MPPTYKVAHLECQFLLQALTIFDIPFSHLIPIPKFRHIILPIRSSANEQFFTKDNKVELSAYSVALKYGTGSDTLRDMLRKFVSRKARSLETRKIIL
jgi:hypothetical protein